MKRTPRLGDEYRPADRGSERPHVRVLWVYDSGYVTIGSIDGCRPVLTSRHRTVLAHQFHDDPYTSTGKLRRTGYVLVSKGAAS